MKILIRTSGGNPRTRQRRLHRTVRLLKGLGYEVWTGSPRDFPGRIILVLGGDGAMLKAAKKGSDKTRRRPRQGHDSTIRAEPSVQSVEVQIEPSNRPFESVDASETAACDVCGAHIGAAEANVGYEGFRLRKAEHAQKPSVRSDHRDQAVFGVERGARDVA